MNNGFRKYDTQHRPHVRHVGVESRIQIPFERRVLTGSVLATHCGKLLRNYSDAENVSYFNTAGERYSTPCPKCLPNEQE